MGYCFMSIDKVKDFRTMEMKYQHNYRVKEVPNAISELKGENKELVELEDAAGNQINYKTAFRDRIKSLDYYRHHRLRSDAVLGLEVVTTLSRDDLPLTDLEKWQEDNVKWLKETFNQAPEKYGDNVISVIYHADEVGSVHCHAFIIPVNKEGRLSAHSYFGGRASLSKLQDSYAKAMSAHNLERGVKGSSAKHTDIKKFYTKLNEKMDVPLPERGESPEEYRKRILELVQKERAGMLRDYMEKSQKMAQKYDMDRNRERSALFGAVEVEKNRMEGTLNTMQEELRKQEKKKKQLIKENKKMEDRLKKTQERYSQLQDQAQKILKSSKKLEELSNKARMYDQQKEIAAYVRSEYPDLADQYDTVTSSMETIYKNRDEIEH